MKKKYFIWENPACAGTDVTWLELTGREFYAFLQRPESKNRYFIRLDADLDPDVDIIYIEATEEQYRAWRREQNAHDYLRRINATFQTISLDYCMGEDEDRTLHDVIADTTADIECLALSRVFCDAPERYFSRLTEEEYELLLDFYVRQKAMTEMAAERGVSQPAISKRNKRLLDKLKKYF